MPCGKRPLVKTWDKPRHIRHITPSRYEQTEECVKEHWQNVLKELEMSYKDEQFWETNCDTVRNLVGPVIFKRIAKIFNLPEEEKQYSPPDEVLDIVKSEEFFVSKAPTFMDTTFSGTYMQGFEEQEEEEEEEESAHIDQDSEGWTETTINHSEGRTRRISSRINASKSISKMLSKSFSRFMSRALGKEATEDFGIPSKVFSSAESAAYSEDDIIVQPKTSVPLIVRAAARSNPFFDMLYCNDSETDMIKWKSKYKQKTFEVSASDEFTKRAEILTKKISNDFYDWWVGLGNVEFKSEIKRPEDIEDLFQVWFDEHASRGLVLDPQILPCVITTIANYTGVDKASCLKALKRQIADDVKAETSPAHTMAFGSSLPTKLKHVPPKNNTSKQWSGVAIPDDLRTMECVWGDIQHLTSTKAFQHWLVMHPNLAMPPFLKRLHAPGGDKKSLFVVPSDFVLKERMGSTSAQELALPVSQFSLELKEVLSKLMNQ